jgi:hypothetical protein
VRPLPFFGVPITARPLTNVTDRMTRSC